MIRPTPELDRFEREYARDRGRTETYVQALDVFTALWVEAATLNQGSPGDWSDDLQPDLAVARALNGLPPGA